MITQANTFVPEAIDLLNNSGFKQFNDVKMGQDLVGQTAVVRPLHIGKLLVSYLIGERDTYRNIAHETLVTFKKNLNTDFNADDLRTLCFDLDIPYEDLGSNTHSGRIQDLIDYGKRHGRLAEIANYCQQKRPRTTWPQFPIVETVSIRPKKELAIVISINNPALETAADYVMEHEIDCNFILLTTAPNYADIKWLPPHGDWDPAVFDFYQTMQQRELKIPRVRRHFFLAVPVPFAFAIGCTWGLVHQGDKLYHWAGSREEGSKYIHVMTSSREWKRGKDDSA